MRKDVIRTLEGILMGTQNREESPVFSQYYSSQNNNNFFPEMLITILTISTGWECYPRSCLFNTVLVIILTKGSNFF